jgi:hypothetical protein
MPLDPVARAPRRTHIAAVFAASVMNRVLMPGAIASLRQPGVGAEGGDPEGAQDCPRASPAAILGRLRALPAAGPLRRAAAAGHGNRPGPVQFDGDDESDPAGLETADDICRDAGARTELVRLGSGPGRPGRPGVFFLGKNSD